jgi:ABC-type Mn2+/Zn2+ transport system permease subunit
MSAQHAAHSEHLIAFAGSMFFSLGAILLLAFFERRGQGLPEGRLGTAYVVASALSILLLSKNRYAETGWLDLLKGEIITIDNYDLEITAATLAVVMLMLLLFHKEFLFVSFDRAMAATLGKRVLCWDMLIYLMIGVTVSISVLSVGPLFSFGFLLVPALSGHLFARNMRQFFVLSSIFGGVTAFLGFWLAYAWDWPVGPTDVVLLGVFYCLAWTVRRLWTLAKCPG